MMVEAKSYHDGVRDGRLDGLEVDHKKHGARLDSHSSRIAKLEKVAWIILGIVLAIEFLPKAKDLVAILGSG